MPTPDIELTASDVQALNGADAIAAFFARLDYNTDARTLQTPANLGMSADGPSAPSKGSSSLLIKRAYSRFIFLNSPVSLVAHTRKD